jgi:uncharacterized membrane protein YfcA
MTAGLAALVAGLAFVTALLSGALGMAGGLLLMGALGLLFPVPEAMALHGLMQGASNGSRAAVLLPHVQWRVFAWFALGAAAAAGGFAALTFVPSKAALYLVLGLVPIVTWLPKDRLNLDAARPLHAVFCGVLTAGLNIASGVSGPLLDVFFVRTTLGRHAIVATKAAVTVLAHALKLAYYGGPLLATAPESARTVGWLFLISLPFTVAGTWAGSRLLERFSDDGFRRWTRRIVTGIGAVYLVRGGLLIAAP